MAEPLPPPFITVSKLGSGWAAICMVFVDDFPEGYWDVQQSGIGRYPTPEGAEAEARGWAEAEELEFKSQKED